MINEIKLLNYYKIPINKIQEIKMLNFIPLGKIRKDWTGIRQGSLLILGRAPKPKNTTDTRAFWWAICLNDFNIIKLSSKSLANGTQSCGCLQKEKASQNAKKRNNSTNKPGFGNRKNLIGKIFGRLKVLEPTDSRYNDGSIIWKCKCLYDNNICYVSSHLLLNNSVQSCGCLSSKGESKIEQFLQNHNIKYKKQYTFKNLLSDKNYPLKFDFGILDDNNNLKYLVEYDGIQHFIYTQSGWNTKEHFQYTQNHDLLKNQYCKNHNIKLIRIKYNEKIEERLLCLLKEL